MNRLIVLTLVALLGCSTPADSGGATTARRTPTPRPSTAPEADEPSSQPEPTAGDPEEPEPAASPVLQVVDLPDRVPPFEALPTERVPLRRGSEGADSFYTRVAHPDAALAAQIEETLRGLAQREIDAPDAETLAGRCQVLLATERLLSAVCELDGDEPSSGLYVVRTFHNFDLTSGRLVPFDPWSAIRWSPELSQRLRSACVGMLRRNGSPAEQAQAQDACLVQFEERRVEVGLYRSGFLVKYDHAEAVRGHSDILVPFSALDRAVFTGTPLGDALAELEGARPVEVELPDWTVAPGRVGTGVAYGEPRRHWEVLAAWFALPAEAREGLLIGCTGQEQGQQCRLVRPGGSGAEHEALGVGSPAQWTQALRPQLVRARRDLARWPTGTLGAAIEGLIGAPSYSAFGHPGTRAYATPVLGAGGAEHVQGSALEPHEGCEPPMAPLLEGVRGRQRRELEQQALRIVTNLREETRAVRAMAYLSQLAYHGPTRLLVVRRDDACRAGEVLLRAELAGSPRSLRFASAAPRGPSLVLVGTNAGPARTRWSLFRLGATAPSWTLETGLATPRVDERIDGVQYPVILDEESRSRRFRWEGDRLVEAD